jgi:hypothetical protein
MSAHISLINGPSKFDLMTALFMRKPEKPTVSFKPEYGHSDYIATILGVTEEDGSGESWNITGYLQSVYVAGGKEHGGAARLVRSARFKGYFSTADRKGWLALVD